MHLAHGATWASSSRSTRVPAAMTNCGRRPRCADLVNGTMTVRMLTEGVHSGDAGGAVPSTFRIARQLLDRIDDSATGMTQSPVFSAPIPEERVTQAAQAAAILGDVV